MAEMDMNNELQEIRFGRNRHLKQILRGIATIETKCKIYITDTKIAVHVLRIGRNEYKTSMAVTSNNIRKNDSCRATTVELVKEIHQEWQIRGAKNSKKYDDDSDQRVKNCTN